MCGASQVLKCAEVCGCVVTVWLGHWVYPEERLPYSRKQACGASQLNSNIAGS